MKKLIITFLLLISMFSTGAFSKELYEIRPVCFDISNSLIFIPVKTTCEKPISENIIYSKTDGINRVTLEINSAKMNTQPQDMFFSAGPLNEFQIVQQSPSTVKITMLFKDNYDVSKLKINNINNNLIIVLKPLRPYNMNYYINTYKESIPNDYAENLIITTRIYKQSTSQPSGKTSVNEIDGAFLSTTGENIPPMFEINDLTKNNNLRSKFYLDKIFMSDELFHIGGAGTISVQKPFFLDNPKRAVFDLPNTTLSKELHNKEFILPCGDKLKSAQFTPNSVRIVITGNDAEKYIPVYYADSQSIILSNPKNLMTYHIPETKTNIVKTASNKTDKLNNLVFEFDKPLCYSIKRTKDYLVIYFLNAEKYNEKNFQSAIRSTPYSDGVISLMKNAGLRLTLPMEFLENISTYLSPDGKVFKISVQKIKPIEPEVSKEDLSNEGTVTSSPKYALGENRNVIVIDAGHGGKDYGAIKNGVNEKDIDLDVSMRLKDILTKKGYTVYMTRTNDTYISLEDRTLFTEGINPAVFVSVHVNSCNMDSPKGIETHYYNENSLELANCVHTGLIKKISGTPNRGLLKSRFYVINHTTVPAVLVEIGFISNPDECRELVTPQRKQATAEGIAGGIIEYLNKQQ